MLEAIASKIIRENYVLLACNLYNEETDRVKFNLYNEENCRLCVVQSTVVIASFNSPFPFPLLFGCAFLRGRSGCEKTE